MPLFPLQSPNLLPEIGAAEPAIVISLKSMSDVALKVVTVSVRVTFISVDRSIVLAGTLPPEPTLSVPMV